MKHQWNYLLFFLCFPWKSIPVFCDPAPGTIYYRKPTKLVFYKKYPQVTYPKAFDDLKLLQPNNGHVNDHNYDFTHSGNFGQIGSAENIYYSSSGIIPKTHHVKYNKYYLLNPGFLEQLIQSDGKFHLHKVERKPFYENWLSWLLGFKNKKEQHTVKDLSSGIFPNYYEDTRYQNEPIYTYHPIKALNTVSPLHQHYEFAHNPKTHPDDIKPVEEHIEGDIKYDFRTKTHSYDR